MSNDELHSGSSGSITRNPSKGTVRAHSKGLEYVLTDLAFCGEDYFEYELWDASKNHKSAAIVTVEVECDPKKDDGELEGGNTKADEDTSASAAEIDQNAPNPSDPPNPSEPPNLSEPQARPNGAQNSDSKTAFDSANKNKSGTRRTVASGQPVFVWGDHANGFTAAMKQTIPHYDDDRLAPSLTSLSEFSTVSLSPSPIRRLLPSLSEFSATSIRNDAGFGNDNGTSDSRGSSGGRRVCCDTIDL